MEKLNLAASRNNKSKAGCSYCFMGEVQVSIPSTPLLTLNLYYRCKAVSAQLKVSSKTLRAEARPGMQ